MSDAKAAFAELTAISNFSFLHGGAHPQEMVHQAASLGYQAIGLADRNTLAGVVRAHVAAREAGIHFLPGARLVTQCDFEAVCYPRDRAAYAALSQCLTRGNRCAVKGQCLLQMEDIETLAKHSAQCWIVIPPADLDGVFREKLASRQARQVVGMFTNYWPQLTGRMMPRILTAWQLWQVGRMRR